MKISVSSFIIIFIICTLGSYHRDICGTMSIVQFQTDLLKSLRFVFKFIAAINMCKPFYESGRPSHTN